jgi:hypothetical protein
VEDARLGRDMRRNPNLADAARQIAALLERAVAEERQACADVAEAFGGDVAREIAAAIRRREAQDLAGPNLQAVAHRALEAADK